MFFENKEDFLKKFTIFVEVEANDDGFLVKVYRNAMPLDMACKFGKTSYYQSWFETEAQAQAIGEQVKAHVLSGDSDLYLCNTYPEALIEEGGPDGV